MDFFQLYVALIKKNINFTIQITINTKRISIVSSRSSRSHSILRKEFFNSVFVHSTSSFVIQMESSCSSIQRIYKPRVLFSALKTSLEKPYDKYTK